MTTPARIILPNRLTDEMRLSVVSYLHDHQKPSLKNVGDGSTEARWLDGLYAAILKSKPEIPNLHKDVVRAMAWHTGKSEADVEHGEYIDQLVDIAVDALEGRIQAAQS